jgi:hypothetical protein
VVHFLAGLYELASGACPAITEYERGKRKSAEDVSFDNIDPIITKTSTPTPTYAATTTATTTTTTTTNTTTTANPPEPAERNVLIRILETRVFNALFDTVFAWYRRRYAVADAALLVRRQTMQHLTLAAFGADAHFLLGEAEAEAPCECAAQREVCVHGPPYATALSLLNSIQHLTGPSAVLAVLDRVVEEIDTAIVTYWHHSSNITRKPESISLNATDVVMILAYLLRRADMGVLQHLTALGFYLSDYFDTCLSTSAPSDALPGTSFREHYASFFLGQAGFSLASLQAATGFLAAS